MAIRPLTKEELDTLSLVTAGMSVLIALLSMIVAYRSGKLASKFQRVSLKQQYFSGLREWADEVVDTISEATVEFDPRLAAPAAEFETKRKAICAKLTAQIDRGRWFFPNIEVEGFGEGKDLAFRGHRHEVLDSLVLAFNLACGAGQRPPPVAGEGIKAELINAKRVFVSNIQKVLEPKLLDKEFRLLTEE